MAGLVVAAVALAPVPLGDPAAASATAATSAPRTLYVTNSGINGAGVANIAAFGIASGGTLVPVGRPEPAAVGVRKIAFSPDGRYAYASNGDNNEVTQFAVDASGTLTPLVPRAEPTNGQSPFGMAIAPNGRTVYVSNVESANLSVLTVGAAGTLRFAATVTTLAEPKGVAVTPNGRFLYVSHGSPGDNDPDVILVFAVAPDGSLVRTGQPVPIGASGAGITITPDGRFLYVACQASDDVFGFSIGANGSLAPVPGARFPAPDFAEGATTSPDGRHVYVASVGSEHPDEDGVWAFTVGADGRLTPATPYRVAAGEGPVGITTTPDGKRLYTSNFRSSDISGFDVQATGGLSPIAGFPVPSRGDGPAFDSVTVNPDQGPVAQFAVAVAGRTARFDAGASADPDGRVARYDWDFGDGTRLPDGGPRPVHTYQRAGTYQVTLTVIDDEGCSTTLIYNGQSPLCSGTSAARLARSIRI